MLLVRGEDEDCVEVDVEEEEEGCRLTLRRESLGRGLLLMFDFGFCDCC